MANSDFVIEGKRIKKYLGDGKEIVIPDGIEDVDYFVFDECKEIIRVSVPESLKSIPGDITTCETLKFNKFDNGLYLGNNENPYLFLVKPISKSIASIEIHKDTKVIDYGALFGCDKLESLDIPDNIIRIGKNAFNYCSGLKRLTIGRGVREIGDSAFEMCRALEEVVYNAVSAEDFVIDASEDIRGPFSRAGELGKGIRLIIGKCVQHIPANFVYGDYGNEQEIKVTSVEFEDGSVCRSIGYSAFRCYSLERVSLADSIEVIGKRAFYSCQRLKEINFPKNLKRIEEEAFSSCMVLPVKELPEGLEYIGEYAFASCYGIREITLPTSLNVIDEGAFKYCSFLERVKFLDKSGWSADGEPIAPKNLTVRVAASLLTDTYNKCRIVKS